MTSKTLVKHEVVMEVREVLKKFQEGYTNRNVDVLDSYMNDLFVNDDSMITVGTSRAAIGSENIEKIILQQREKWDEMILNINESIINTEENTATIVTSGILKKVLSSDELLSKEWNNIKETLQKEGKGVDKLFEVQKQIAYTFKELSFGEESLWEFRFEAIAVKEDNKWQFHNIQFTYPSLHVFEGNYSMTPLL